MSINQKKGIRNCKVKECVGGKEQKSGGEKSRGFLPKRFLLSERLILEPGEEQLQSQEQVAASAKFIIQGKERGKETENIDLQSDLSAFSFPISLWFARIARSPSFDL